MFRNIPSHATLLPKLSSSCPGGRLRDTGLWWFDLRQYETLDFVTHATGAG